MATDKLAAPRLFDPGAPTRLTLFDRFLVPPFSVLDSRAGYWQDRKRAWLALGIKSELGRDEKLLGYETFAEAGVCKVCGGAKVEADGRTRCHACQGTGKAYGKTGQAMAQTTSVFDPVVCELVYRWFSPQGGTVLDPFAGGSVRGIVAGCLERHYLGIDLRGRQVAANIDQLVALRDEGRLVPPWEPRWVEGDSRDATLLWARHEAEASRAAGSGGQRAQLADLVFSCPPYFDLEQYSSDPRDLSNAGEYAAFLASYQEIIAGCVGLLADDRFAVFVVADVRAKDGSFHGLVRDTQLAFEAAGARFYNEGILATSLGSLPIRTAAQFGGNRKLGKAHQNVLVFVKGDPKVAAAACGMPEEVAVEQGGAVWHADATVAAPDDGVPW